MKIAIDAGHGYNTAGKRTPDGEREWSFNNIVARAATQRLQEYIGVEVIRTDDPTGATDVALTTRTNKANAWKADLLVSFHHNANTGQWGTWGGTETYTYNGSYPKTEAIAQAIHSRMLGAYGLRNRGLKKADFHMLRATTMPAVLIEGGFMDSLTDIPALRNGALLANAGKAAADGIASYFGLKLKDVPVTPPVVEPPKPEPVPTPPQFTADEVTLLKRIMADYKKIWEILQ